MARRVTAFKRKLEVQKSRLARESLSHFSDLKPVIGFASAGDEVSFAGRLEQLQVGLRGGISELVAVEPTMIFSDNPCNEKNISKIPVSTVQYFQPEDSAKVKIEFINLQKDMILKSHYSVGKLRKTVNKITFQLSLHQNNVTCISDYRRGLDW
jgi:hypothetical protein